MILYHESYICFLVDDDNNFTFALRMAVGEGCVLVRFVVNLTKAKLRKCPHGFA